MLSTLVFLGAVIVCFSSITALSAMNGPFERSFEMTYAVHLEPLSAAAKQVHIWIPLAASNRHQTIQRRIIQAPVPYRITRDPEYGNDILFLDLRELKRPLDLAIRYETLVREEALLASTEILPPDTLPDSAKSLYLKSGSAMVVNRAIRDLAQRVTAGAATSTEKARAIYRYVIERMTYEKETPGWGNGDTLRACAVGAGNCTDFHSLFISLARAVGIPARFEIGLLFPDKPEGDIPGYHCWASFYLPGKGWIPVDASEAWKHREKVDYFFGTYDPNRLELSNGRDIELIPRPASGPRNIFFFPYAEADGKAVAKDRIKTEFKFRGLEVKNDNV